MSYRCGGRPRSGYTEEKPLPLYSYDDRSDSWAVIGLVACALSGGIAGAIIGFCVGVGSRLFK